MEGVGGGEFNLGSTIQGAITGIGSYFQMQAAEKSAAATRADQRAANTEALSFSLQNREVTFKYIAFGLLGAAAIFFLIRSTKAA